MSRRSERFRNGAWNPAEVFETDEGELLRTPTAAEVEGGPVSPKIAKEKGQTLRLTGQLLDLLPTPLAQDSAGAMRPEDRAKSGEGYGPALRDVPYLMPTPNTMDMLPAPDESKIDRSKGGYANVRETVMRPHFGQFAPAIERWETMTGNSAPDPTIADGRDGQHRLNASFTEWMMGLPNGWITRRGLSRKDEIKMCGNGVVPQQAKLALKLLRDRYDRAGDNT